MKTKYSSALLIIVLMLVAGIGSVKINSSFPKTTIFKKIITTNFVETSLSIESYTNKLVRIRNMQSGKCIKFAGPNTRLNQFDCQDTPEFYWFITKNPDNSYLVASSLGNYVFDNNKSKTNNGNPELAYAIHVGSNQRWYINSWGDNSWRFTNQQNKKCLDLNNGTSNNGPHLQLWDCLNNNKRQGFYFDVKKDLSCRPEHPELEKFANATWVQIIDQDAKKCLKYTGVNKRLVLASCDVTRDFAWKLDANDDGTYFITSYRGKLVFDNNGSIKRNGNAILVSKKKGGANQRWKIKPWNDENTFWRFEGKQSRKCIDVPEGNNSTEVGLQLWDCQEDNTKQSFLFKEITPITAKIALAKYVGEGKYVQIVNPRNNKCLRFKGPYKQLVQHDCEDNGEFAYKLDYNADDKTYTIQNILGNYVFDNYGSYTNNGNKIILFSRHTGSNQRWRIQLWDSKSFIFRGKQSNKCIYIPKGQNKNGVGLQLWECQNGNANQKFIFRDYQPKENTFLAQFVNQYIRIQNAGSKKCLRPHGSSSKLIQDDCKELGIFAWKITKNTNDDTFTVTSYSNQQVFDINGSDSKNGNSILSYAKQGSANQRWYIQSWSIDSFFFKGKKSFKCIDDPNGNTANGVNMQLFDCQKKNQNQRWIFTIVDPNLSNTLLSQYYSGWFKIYSPTSGKCWKMASTNGNLVQYDCDETDEFAFQLSQNPDQSFFITTRVGNYVVDNNQSGTTNGNPVLVYAKHGGDNQRWYILPWDSKSYRFIGKQSNKSIGVQAGTKNNGAKYRSFETQSGNINQNFIFLPFAEKIKVRGYFKNAINNQLIPAALLGNNNAQITFISGTKEYKADILEGSIYEVSLPRGSFSRIATLKGFSEMNQTVSYNQPLDVDTAGNILFFSPVINGWRVVLTWGATPKDLDSHLVLPNGEDVFYSNKKSTDGRVILDVDATAGFGPETITLTAIDEGLKGDYKFYVYNYTKESVLSTSGAKVTVFNGNKLVEEISIDPKVHPDNFNWWHVLTINANTNTYKIFNEVKIAID